MPVRDFALPGSSGVDVTELSGPQTTVSMLSRIDFRIAHEVYNYSNHYPKE